eukprot:470650-Rhodomonas_salina.1
MSFRFERWKVRKKRTLRGSEDPRRGEGPDMMSRIGVTSEGWYRNTTGSVLKRCIGTAET